MRFKLFIISFILIGSFIMPDLAYNNFRRYYTYKFAKQNFKTIKKSFYYYMDYKCYKLGVDPLFALSVVRIESNFRNVVSEKNRNGSRDYGFFQINEIHGKKNPRKFLNYKKNVDMGILYLKWCLKKSKGNKRLACIYYNGGLNCNVKRYKRRKKKKNYYPKLVTNVYWRLVRKFKKFRLT